MYRFAVDSPTQNFFRIRRLGPGVRGTCHADEVGYIFKNSFAEVPEVDTMEFRSIKRFVRFGFLKDLHKQNENFVFQISLLTSFAATGNPSANIIQADMQDVDVAPVDTQVPPFKGISFDQDTVSFGILPEFERLKIWDQLFRDADAPLY